MKIKICIFLFFVFLNSVNAQVVYPSSNINLVGFCNPETVAGVDAIKYSGCWGWNQTLKNKEYAIIGSSTGTYFIDISAPATPTVCDYVKGAHLTPCIWREIKTYQNFCYIVGDDSSPNSFQIIDMQYLPDSVHVVYDGKLTYFERAHTLWVDGNKLYVGGITLSGGGGINMRVYSLATPTAPLLLRTLSQDYPSITYVHDMFVRNDTVYASCGYQGLQVYKFTAGNTFTVLGSLTSYPQSGYNHSSYLTQNGKNLVFCDEVPTNLAVKVADVTNLANITVSSLFRPNLFTGFVGHNPYGLGNKWVFVSCYEDGLNLYDISTPTLPVLSGYFDTHPLYGANVGGNYGPGSYNGNWGSYPFFKSGLILAVDMQNGVFILEAYGLLGCSIAPSKPISVSGNTFVCAGATLTYSTSAVLSATSYNWSLPGGWSGASTTNTISVTTNNIGGTISVNAANACGTSSLTSKIIINGTPTITVNNGAICAGKSFTIVPSGANTYTYSGGTAIVSPTTNTSYSVSGTSTAGCVSVAPAISNVTVNPLPIVNATTNNSIICGPPFQGTATLTGSGAVTYTWSPGGAGITISVSPSVTSTYTLSGTNANGCMNSSVITQSVSICAGISGFNSKSQNYLNVYPNPSIGKLFIEVSNVLENTEIIITSVVGKTIMAEKIKTNGSSSLSTELDISELSCGIYFLNLIGSNNLITTIKLIKQ